MKIFAAMAAALVLFTMPASSWADGVLAALHGGQVVETPEGFRVEFVVVDGGIRAFVRDHGDKPTVAEGKVALLVAGKKLDVPLKADGTMLTGDAPVAAAEKVMAVLSLTVAGKPTSARFVKPEGGGAPMDHSGHGAH